jgi:hypothetical protein
MKIFIVMFGYDEEGYGEPEAVFATKSMAELYVQQQSKRACRTGDYGCYEIFVRNIIE